VGPGVSQDPFELIEQALASGGPASALDLLARKFLDEKKYPQLFEARLMQTRLELGLPLIQLSDIEELPEPARSHYEDGVRQAARETGGLFLASGDIPHAWPYFRAIGERDPIQAALEHANSGEQIDALIEIALGERVHPRRGLELVIERHGICRAISLFEEFPNLEQREDCWKLLVRTLHAEVVSKLKNAIAGEEGSPETNSIPELIQGRDWLFGEFAAYADTSHIVNVIRFAVEFEDREALTLVLELCEYGAHLSPQFKMRGEPPFEDIYREHAIYLRAAMGEDVDSAIEYFRGKITAQEDPLWAIRCADLLVRLLVRCKKYDQAVQISMDYLNDADPRHVSCPTLIQLCQLAGDTRRMREFARDNGDFLSYAAGLIQG
jgi:hypothetical protein